MTDIDVESDPLYYTYLEEAKQFDAPDLERKYALLRSERHTFQEIIMQQTTSINEKDTEIERLQREVEVVDSATHTIEELKSVKSKLLQEVKSLKSSIKEKNEEIERLIQKEHITDHYAEHSIEQLKSEKSKLLQEVESLKRKHKEKIAQFKQDEHNKYVEKFAEYRKQIELYKHQARMWQNNSQQASRELDRWKENCKEEIKKEYKLIKRSRIPFGISESDGQSTDAVQRSALPPQTALSRSLQALEL